MIQRKTKEEFIEEARAIHGDKYDYSKVEYINTNTKVCIICPKHGEFWQTPKNHLKGQGCRKCGHIKAHENTRDTKEQFVEKAKAVHGDKYDYSKVEYTNNRAKVCIICPKHGEFWQVPYHHLRSCGCPKCTIESGEHTRAFTTEEFIERAKGIHGDKYDYSKVVYKGGDKDICIICPIHGEFWQKPHVHLNSCGCPKCGIENSANSRRKTINDFIEKANEIHHNFYNYSKVNYTSASNLVTIICPKHGEFQQRPLNHLMGQGCPKCGNLRKGSSVKLTTQEFVDEAKGMYGGKYDYSNVEYINNHTKVCIICPEHGEFWQRPIDHLHGHSCPKCGHTISQAEKDISAFVKSIIGDDNVIENARNIISNGELDIYIPARKLAIEYDGLRWHSEEFGKDRFYHLNKTEQCKVLGIKLIHIFEDEWLEHEDIVKHKLSHILGYDVSKKIIGARKCEIKIIDNVEVEPFLNEYHIQGFAPSTIYIGAYYQGELVGVMTFKEEVKNSNEWELNRLVTTWDYSLPGLASKMFKHFINIKNPLYVKSFLDRRWNIEGNTVYERMGFCLEKIEKPDYYYVNNQTRFHKFNFRKQLINKRYGLPLTMTENEMVKELGYFKIWNCGLAKYVWTNVKEKGGEN